MDWPPGPDTKYALERDFRRDVVRFAKENGWKVHWEVDHRNKPATGFPDLVLAKKTGPMAGGAHVLFRELKMAGTYLRADQDDWRVFFERAGMDYRVWRPKDWDDIKETLSV
jgi:hypothetical protein